MSEEALYEKGALQLILTELQRQYDAHMNALEVLDGKASNLLGWSSLAVTIGTAIRASDLASSGEAALWVAIAAVILYIGIVIVSLASHFPRDYHSPVLADTENICTAYVDDGEQNTLEQLVVQYVAAITKNMQFEQRRAWLIRAGFCLLPALIITLIVMIALPLC